jgi:hypothetical protein
MQKRIIESTLVMVGGAKVQHHSVAGPHRHAANLNVGSRIARQFAAAFRRRSKDLLDRGCQ